jgi:hypothetical protein
MSDIPSDIELCPVIQTFPLESAADAVNALARGELHGAAVLTNS